MNSLFPLLSLCPYGSAIRHGSAGEPGKIIGRTNLEAISPRWKQIDELTVLALNHFYERSAE